MRQPRVICICAAAFSGALMRCYADPSDCVEKSEEKGSAPAVLSVFCLGRCMPYMRIGSCYKRHAMHYSYKFMMRRHFTEHGVHRIFFVQEERNAIHKSYGKPLEIMQLVLMQNKKHSTDKAGYEMSRTLVLYFSVYGTAKKTAEEIARQTGADLQEIVPAIPYDSNRDHYSALAKRAKEEHDADMRPAIKNPIDIEEYDTIFIGYPMWWYTFPMILYTLFDQLDFSGKTIIPFNTHMGSGDGGTYETIRKLEPNARVLEGLPVEMSEAEHGAADRIAEWLKNLR